MREETQQPFLPPPLLSWFWSWSRPPRRVEETGNAEVAAATASAGDLKT
jgi:hypothetical protein